MLWHALIGASTRAHGLILQGLPWTNGSLVPVQVVANGCVIYKKYSEHKAFIISICIFVVFFVYTSHTIIGIGRKTLNSFS